MQSKWKVWQSHRQEAVCLFCCSRLSTHLLGHVKGFGPKA